MSKARSAEGGTAVSIMTTATAGSGCETSLSPNSDFNTALTGHTCARLTPLVHVPSTPHENTLGHSWGPGTLSTFVSTITTRARGTCPHRAPRAPLYPCIPVNTTTAHFTSSGIMVPPTAAVASSRYLVCIHCVIKVKVIVCQIVYLMLC